MLKFILENWTEISFTMFQIELVNEKCGWMPIRRFLGGLSETKSRTAFPK